MLKNVIIAIQAAILFLVAIWSYFYQHRVEQIFVTENIKNNTIEAKFKFGIAELIDNGRSEDAARMLRNVAASNVQSARESISELDLRMEDLVSDAYVAAEILEEIDIKDLSKALEERKSALQ